MFGNMGGELAYLSSGDWYAASVPSGSTQVSVGTAEAATELTIAWKSS